MIKVLDHGYVHFIESWGSDERIVEAARMSTDKGFKGWGYICPGPNCMPVEMPGDINHCEHKPPCQNGWVSGDEKLLKYLYEHKHMTPFEMGGLIIEVQAPIFVFREWHRHRTQCLAANTLIHFDAPKAEFAICHQRIDDLWRKWQPTVAKSRPRRQKNELWPRSRIQEMRLRCADETTNEIEHTSIFNVIRGEQKPMITVTTTSGRTLTATREHRVLTNLGWMTLGEAVQDSVPLALEGYRRDKLRRWDVILDETNEEWKPMWGYHGLYEVSSEGRVRAIRDYQTARTSIKAGTLLEIKVHRGGYNYVTLRHIDDTHIRLVHQLVLETFVGRRPNGCEARHLNNNMADSRLSNLTWGTSAENANDRVISDRQQRLHVIFEEIAFITDAGMQTTFDLTVKGPWHNFIANGFVVHNSYNELSARYTPLPDVNYVPTIERLLMTSSTNKQAQGISQYRLDEQQCELWLESLKESYVRSETTYKVGLDWGIPKELARLPVPVGRYSRMRASTNLRNWLMFLTLRLDTAAQWEIRQYAQAVSVFIAERFPRTYNLFANTKS